MTGAGWSLSTGSMPSSELRTLTPTAVAIGVSLRWRARSQRVVQPLPKRTNLLSTTRARSRLRTHALFAVVHRRAWRPRCKGTQRRAQRVRATHERCEQARAAAPDASPSDDSAGRSALVPLSAAQPASANRPSPARMPFRASDPWSAAGAGTAARSRRLAALPLMLPPGSPAAAPCVPPLCAPSSAQPRSLLPSCSPAVSAPRSASRGDAGAAPRREPLPRCAAGRLWFGADASPSLLTALSTRSEPRRSLAALARSAAGAAAPANGCAGPTAAASPSRTFELPEAVHDSPSLLPPLCSRLRVPALLPVEPLRSASGVCSTDRPVDGAADARRARSKTWAISCA